MFQMQNTLAKFKKIFTYIFAQIKSLLFKYNRDEIIDIKIYEPGHGFVTVQIAKDFSKESLRQAKSLAGDIWTEIVKDARCQSIREQIIIHKEACISEIITPIVYYMYFQAMPNAIKNGKNLKDCLPEAMEYVGKELGEGLRLLSSVPSNIPNWIKNEAKTYYYSLPDVKKGSSIV